MNLTNLIKGFAKRLTSGDTNASAGIKPTKKAGRRPVDPMAEALEQPIETSTRQLEAPVQAPMQQDEVSTQTPVPDLAATKGITGGSGPLSRILSIAKTSLKGVGVAFLLIIALAIGAGIQKSHSEDSAYRSYVDNHETIDAKYFDINDTFDIWNASDVGNDANTLLSGGKLYRRNGISVMPKKEGVYTIERDGKTIGATKNSISYINGNDGKLFYRNDKTRNIVSFDINTAKEETLVEGNHGELFLYNSKLYYIDIANRSISSLNLNDGTSSIVYEHPSESFVVIGDTLIVLDTNMCLWNCTLVDGKVGNSKKLATHIERFFLNGGVVAESGGIILSFDTNGQNGKELYKAGLDTMRLVGVTGDTVLLQEDESLYALTGEVKTAIEEDRHKLYLSPLPPDDEVLYIVATTDSKGGRSKESVLKLQLKTPGSA